jgi:hypothetical protein
VLLIAESLYTAGTTAWLFQFLPGEQRQAFIEQITEKAS